MVNAFPLAGDAAEVDRVAQPDATVSVSAPTTRGQGEKPGVPGATGVSGAIPTHYAAKKPMTSPLDTTLSSHYGVFCSVRPTEGGTPVNMLDRLLANERGANILEYTVMISLIALVAMFAISFVGQATTANITPVLDHL